MAMFNVNPQRQDPYRNFKFRVILDGKVVAGISKVSALVRTTDAVTHRDGGDPSSSKKSPGLTQYEPIVLERGLSHDNTFEEWANMISNIQGDASVSLANYKKDIAIELLNLQGAVVMRFLAYRCWVSEYQSLPELDANGNCTAIEKIVLQHEGWERDTEVTEPTET